MDFLTYAFIFLLAMFLGVELIRKVPAQLHTPLMSGSNAISGISLIGAMVDGVLLVVRLGETPRHYVEQTYNQPEALGGNILGTCLTGANLEDTSANYSRRD